MPKSHDHNSTYMRKEVCTEKEARQTERLIEVCKDVGANTKEIKNINSRINATLVGVISILITLLMAIALNLL